MEEQTERRKFDLKKIVNSVLDRIYGDTIEPESAKYLERFLLRHAIFGKTFQQILFGGSNIKGLIKEIILNVLCWIFAFRLIIDLIVFMKVKDPNAIKYYGYFGNAFGKDKISISILSGVLMGMISSFHSFCKLTVSVN